MIRVLEKNNAKKGNKGREVATWWGVIFKWGNQERLTEKATF